VRPRILIRSIQQQLSTTNASKFCRPLAVIVASDQRRQGRQLQRDRATTFLTQIPKLRGLSLSSSKHVVLPTAPMRSTFEIFDQLSRITPETRSRHFSRSNNRRRRGDRSKGAEVQSGTPAEQALSCCCPRLEEQVEEKETTHSKEGLNIPYVSLRSVLAL
jgi:hypothetical protein